MNEITKDGGNYVGYEYKEVTVSRDMENVYADGFPSFGWQPDGSSYSALGISTVNMKFKRDRKIRNKAELTRLQRQFDSNVKEIEKLEQSKASTASITALSIGIIGTALMAGSVFAVISSMIPLSVILAVPALIGWIMPYFSYGKVKQKRIETVTPLIEQQYDAIYETCEKAHSLLA